MPELPGAGTVDSFGLRLDELGPSRVTGRLVAEPRHLQPFGLVHGGVFATIAETLASVGATIAASQGDPGRAAVGLENHTSFLRSASLGTEISGEAVVRHGGRRVQVWTVTMRDEAGTELAISTVRLLVVEPTPR
jgi:1,4-dihydroxy-2-naphthoyl-CoA hydrolase